GSPCLRDLHSFPTRRSSDLDGAVARGRVGADERRERRGPHFIARVGLEGGARQLRGPHTTELPQRRYARAPYLRRGVTQGGCERSEEHTSELQSRENLVCRL